MIADTCPRSWRLLDADDERLATRVLVRCGLRGPDLEDSLQEVRLRVLRSAPPEGRLGPWVARVARNVALDHHRSARRRLDLAARLASAGRSPASAPDPTARLVVLGALSRLRPEHRQVLALRFLAGLSLRDTAAVLGVREGTVKSRLHRATAALRPALAGGRDLRWTA